MRVTVRRLVAVAASAVAASCAAHGWVDRIPNKVVCTVNRAPVAATIDAGGDTVDAGYARVIFAPNTFSGPTPVTMTAYPGYHGFTLVFPTLNSSPQFVASFDVDYCGAPPANAQYYISTSAGGRQPARVGRQRDHVERTIAPGELTDEVKRAGLFAPGAPLVSGFVILSN